MALSAAIQWEVQTGGSDLFGGGFKAGASGTDYTTSAPTVAHATLSAASLVNATTSRIDVNAGDYTVAAGDVGNVLQITGGTATAGFYEITAINQGGANQWTLDRSAGTAGQTVVGRMGGALATPGKAAPAANVAGQKIWVKAGTYTLTTSTPGAAGPVVFSSAIRMTMEGYSATRGDRGGRPSVNAGAVTTINIFTGNGSASQAYIHMEANGNSGSGVTGFLLNNGGWLLEDCYAKNCDQASQAGFSATLGALVRCGASACTTGFSFITTGGFVAVRCWADACGVGFNTTVTGAFVECAATDCTGDGFNSTANSTTFVGCTSEGNGGDGFDIGTTATRGMHLIGCVATNNTGYGYNSGVFNFLDYCAWLTGVGTARTNTAPGSDTNQITLTGDPWTNAASDDLRPDNTAAEGSALRNIANVGVFGQTDNRDIGAVQHPDTTPAYVIGG